MKANYQLPNTSTSICALCSLLLSITHSMDFYNLGDLVTNEVYWSFDHDPIQVRIRNVAFHV